MVVRQREALADLQLAYVDQADFERTEIHFPLPPVCRDQGMCHSARFLKFSETRSLYVAQIGLELVIFLLQA